MAEWGADRARPWADQIHLPRQRVGLEADRPLMVLEVQIRRTGSVVFRLRRHAVLLFEGDVYVYTLQSRSVRWPGRSLFEGVQWR